MTRKVGLVGYGYWGRNLARCFKELGVLTVIADKDSIRRSRAIEEQDASCYGTLGAILDYVDPVDAIAIATPPETHYDIAQQALNEGKDVFIEKPMTTSYNDAVHLAEIAKDKERNLMVGHIYLHNGGIKAMPIPVGKAELYVQLLNEGGGPSPSTRDVVWAGLPHACSLALHFFPDEPEWIEAKREGERIKVMLAYWNSSMAYLDVGDNTGRKLREVELRNGASTYSFSVSSPGRMAFNVGLGWNSGGGPNEEPLMTECKAFLEYKGVDLMGPKVVKLIEGIVNACKT